VAQTINALENAVFDDRKKAKNGTMLAASARSPLAGSSPLARPRTRGL